MEDQMIEYNTDAEHPTPEQLLIRQAVDEGLTTKQKIIWEMYNYDKMTLREIADALEVHFTTIDEHIRMAEKKIVKWCSEHLEVYKTLKGDK